MIEELRGLRLTTAAERVAGTVEEMLAIKAFPEERRRRVVMRGCSTCTGPQLFPSVSARLESQWAFRRSALKQPLNASMNALSGGFPVHLLGHFR